MIIADLIAAGITHALTLHPEHAEAVRNLDKRVENRGQDFPARHLGKRIAIHAGALHRGRQAMLRGLAVMIEHARGAGWTVDSRFAVGGGAWIEFHKASPAARSRRLDTTALVTSAIVATAVVRRTLTPLDTPTEPWHLPGVYGWVLDDVEVLDTPIPAAPGQLGLWTLARVCEAA